MTFPSFYSVNVLYIHHTRRFAKHGVFHIYLTAELFFGGAVFVMLYGTVGIVGR